MIEVDENKLVEMIENIISDYTPRKSRVLKSIKWYLLDLSDYNSFNLSKEDLEKFKVAVFNKASEIEADLDI